MKTQLAHKPREGERAEEGRDGGKGGHVNPSGSATRAASPKPVVSRIQEVIALRTSPVRVEGYERPHTSMGLGHNEGLNNSSPSLARVRNHHTASIPPRTKPSAPTARVIQSPRTGAEPGAPQRQQRPTPRENQEASKGRRSVMDSYFGCGTPPARVHPWLSAVAAFTTRFRAGRPSPPRAGSSCYAPSCSGRCSPAAGCPSRCRPP